MYVDGGDNTYTIGCRYIIRLCRYREMEIQT
jgi:hypothetical protein